MTILLILLILLFILVILNLFTYTVNEGFKEAEAVAVAVAVASEKITPEIQSAYKKFLSFYTAFITSWEKVISSSTIANSPPQEPLTSPSQVSQIANYSPPSPSVTDMNAYITQLTQQLNQPLPPLGITFPQTIDTKNISQIIAQMPTDSTPFINALNWMNQQLEKSHANLGSALQGNKPEIEGFDSQDTTCQNISSCLASNPQLIAEIAQELDNKDKESIQQQEQQLTSLIQPFISSETLLSSLQQNQVLLKKSQDIQNQAQSGELVNQINVPGGNTIATYTKPQGSDTLKQMENNDPAQYNNLKNNYSQWFSLKQLLEQINSNL
jgi:hypothetical protein